MRKIILLLFLSLSFVSSLSFANTGGLQEQIDSYNKSLFEDLKQEKNNLVGNYSSTISNFTGKENYKVLKNLNKIELGSTKDNLLDKYFSLKQNILQEFSKYSSNYSILKEKFEENLITEEKYEEEVDDIKAEVDSIKSKYEGLISDFVDKYSNNISSLTGDFKNKVNSNSGTIESIKQKKEKLSKLKSSYNKFENFIEEVNNLYRVNTDNLYDFLKEVNDITVNLLKEKFNNKAKSYYDKYVNLDYYSGDINEFKKSLVSEYKDNLKNYYGNLIEGFYTEDNYNYIKENYSSIKENFYNNGNINYEVLVNENLGDGYNKLIKKLKNVNSEISGNLAKVGNPEDLSSLKTNLKDKLKEFYNAESQDYVKKLEDFIEKQTELLSYKTSDELEVFNNLKAKKEEIEKLTGTDSKKLQKMENFLGDIESKKFISDDLNKKIKEMKYEIMYNSIDLKISEQGLNKYNSDYDNIDKTLQNILSNLYKGYKEKDKGQNFKEKLKGAFSKIEKHLKDKKISSKSKYLVLKIKKAIIDFLYLENK